MNRLIFLYLLMISFGIPENALAYQRADVPEKQVPAFVYHRFGDDRYPATNISNENFERHLNFLSKEGFQPFTYAESIRYLTERGGARKAVCITIDDGYRSFLENGFPLLQKYGFKATIFINTETVGAADFMNWEELKKLQEAGIEIGNHSHSHDYFLNNTDSTGLNLFAEDLEKSQALIEEKLGRRPTTFAYPYGEFDAGMKQVVADAGFVAATAQTSGVMHPEMDNFATPRFPMSDRYGKLGSFIEKVTMKPINVTKVEAIDKGYNGSPDNPQVIFHFPQKDLRIESVQCFAQGMRCTKSVRIDKDGNVKLYVKSKEVLTSRRTLYTITIPDSQGNWHWYSYSWVIKTLK